MALSRPLASFFNPRTVAIIGASEKKGSVGRALLDNLRGFSGNVFPVNPKHSELVGIQTFPSIAAVPTPVDLAVIATPAATVPQLIADCGKAGVPAAIIISAGFKEVGAVGQALEAEILASARRFRMRVIGPNCLGVMAPHSTLNATFASRMALPGSVGFISQSGALCTAILDWSFRANVGFSAFVSIGSMLDVSWGDLIYCLGDDPHTKSIVIYMESVGDARSFLSAAREVALSKPIVIIKAGRTAPAAKAAASHTGSLTGSDDVLDAAFQRAGVLRVGTISELFNMADVLSKQPRPAGPRLGIVTNAGGPAVLATDTLMNCSGELAALSETSIAALNGLLPAAWSHGNPVDLLGDASPTDYRRAAEILAGDPGTDGLLVILTPQAMTNPTATAEELAAAAKRIDKPLLASWMGADEVESGRRILNAANIPEFEYPDVAADAFAHMWRYSYNLRALYETPALLSGVSATARAQAEKSIQKALRSGRSQLTELEAHEILCAYEIPMVPLRMARSADEAAAVARELGFPVALKLYSETITHKTDVGGVKLGLATSAAVKRAFEEIYRSVKTKKGAHHFLGVVIAPMIVDDEGYELILGSSVDPQFGPVLLFGAGGRLVEAMPDRALGLPPLNETLARRVMERTAIHRALQGIRGRKPVDMIALEQVLIRFSQLVADHPWIKEVDVNPLLAAPTRIVGLDCRIILHPPETKANTLPKLAIRPYPIEYVSHWKFPNGPQVVIRPIRPEDEPLMVAFHKTLSERTVHFRYFTPMKLGQRIAHDRLSRICFIDYDREIALVAEISDPHSGGSQIVGVGRLSKIHGVNSAEFAVLVSDAWQGRGLGTHLLKQLVKIGRTEKLSSIIGHILAQNHVMQTLCEELGFTLTRLPDQAEYRAELIL